MISKILNCSLKSFNAVAKVPKAKAQEVIDMLKQLAWVFDDTPFTRVFNRVTYGWAPASEVNE